MSDIESKFIEVNLLSWNAVCQERDRLKSENAALEKKVEKLREALKEVEAKQPEALAKIRKHKFVFRGKGGRWEKLAFTLYTDICELHSHAQAALSDGSEK